MAAVLPGHPLEPGCHPRRDVPNAGAQPGLGSVDDIAGQEVEADGRHNEKGRRQDRAQAQIQLKRQRGPLVL